MCGIDKHTCEDGSGDERAADAATDRGERTAIPGDVDRRRFLRWTGATAGAGAVLGASGSAAGDDAEDPYTERFVAADSSNFSDDWRGADDIDWIVVHVTVGSYEGAIDWFRNPDANVSAHYVISNYEHTSGEPGHTTQMVNHRDVAWHASASNGPSIGIEHEWHEDYGEYITEECYERSGQLIGWLCDEYDIPKEYYRDPTCIFDEPGGIIGHTNAPSASDCSSYPTRSCPYPEGGIDPDTLMSYVNGDGDDGGDETFQDDDGAMTTTDLNGREGPGLDYDVVNTYPEGEVGRVVNGPEDSDGYRWWGLHMTDYDEWVWCVERYLERVKFHMEEEIYTTTDLNGREGPGLDYDVVGTYPEGTVGEIVNGPEDSDGYRWWGVHYPDYGDWVWCVERYMASNE
ncbi:N-acetylmuramoyl-L-alanine amidase [Halovivax sp.]|uniref:N-acetylmuramoyl-L-alanine amidase n=1 Tax=Halovivax sp. TaxID=1935978 RepID=UPI0025C30618|nr:N-acetylmuramoyl-L-alanine amidase [Halovivax sp.]